MGAAAIESLCLEFEEPNGATVEVDGTTLAAYMHSRPRHHCVDTRLSALVCLRDGFEAACHHLDHILWRRFVPFHAGEQPILQEIFFSAKGLCTHVMRRTSTSCLVTT